MALYNSAIYLGRSLSFTSVLICEQLGLQNPFSVQMVPLDSLDVNTMSILYTTGDMVAVVPLYSYDFQLIYDVVDKPQAWRSLLEWLGIPGFIIAATVLFLVKEPSNSTISVGDLFQSILRNNPIRRQVEEDGSSQSPSRNLTVRGFSKQIGDLNRRTSQLTSFPRQSYSQYAKRTQRVRQRQQISSFNAKKYYSSRQNLRKIRKVYVRSQPSSTLQTQSLQNTNFLQRVSIWVKGKGQNTRNIVDISQERESSFNIFGSVSFIALTMASGMNDVGSWAMIAWHATFYERAFDLSPDIYAPLLAMVIPLGGIAGGVGGGLIADKLTQYGKRSYLTVGAMLLAVPFISYSFLTDSYQLSFLSLLIGFALSEAWRAPAAIMVRSTVPNEMIGYASAVHLSIRNLVGCVGPLGVAMLIQKVGVHQAMTVVPACYFLSALGFWWVESIIEE
eukprot:TRINITY_DN2336_c0_g3_i1.p1 TRINITY_DN2336_c0_g3~~TRINITY_DN2336_c0_g3_i1.p1  ORF type:complete len:447 (-),score=34.67 TRINITY_DN2336_c0_g3_i1:245-1585(-)